jgi:protein-S-isoprenylcysteine O-methyltransferase Ste14
MMFPSAIMTLTSLAGFAVFHSLFAGPRAKQAAARLVGEQAYLGLYRALYNAASLVTFAPVMLIVAAHPGPVVWAARGPTAWVLTALQAVSIAGLVYAGSQIDLWRLAGVRQALAYFGRETLPLTPERFVQNGMYGLVRHPLYLCLIVYLWAAPTMHAAQAAFALGSTVYFVTGGWLEERRLISDMHMTYLEYRERVPFLIPFLHVPSSRCCMSHAQTGGD